MRYLIFAIIFLSGCAGTTCVSVGGTYGTVDGNVEYCYDSRTSDSVGRVVFGSPNGNKLYGLTQEDMNTLAGMLSTSMKASDPSVSAKIVIEKLNKK